MLDIRELVSPNVCRAACIEFVSMMLYTYISFSISITAVRQDLRIEVVALLHVFLVALFIMATGTASGAHFNPNITLVMLFSRMITLGRAVWYIAAHIVGATVAGFMIRVASGAPALLDKIRCSYAEEAGVGAALVNEVLGNWVFLFITLYLALDAKQQKAHGNLAGPLLVGSIVGIMIIGNASMQQGLSASMNSARCLGGGVAALTFDGLWVSWVGGLVASLLAACFYNAVPPHHTAIYSR
jgi:glycerol uptake facilitator-like aquaporin